MEKLRSSVIPGAAKGTDMKADVGGSTAGYIDLASRISEKLPLQILVVIALSFVLLILAFRTAVIPAQAAVMNLLSIGASYGVLTAIFQYGWLADVIGLTGPVPIVSYVPLFMFAVLFGLSMDYEVFLVSQIEEHVHAGEDNRSSVVSGLVTSARVITAAALIMVFVFGSFVLNGDPTIKQFGIGLAVAVVLDATVVRCLLVPALMLLMGKVNWWMPKWLERHRPAREHRGRRVLRGSRSRGRRLDHDLRADEVRGEPLAAKHLNLPDVRARADVQRLAERRQLVAVPAEASTLTFSSTVVKPLPSGRWRIVPHAATVSAKATHAPPCT